MLKLNHIVLAFTLAAASFSQAGVRVVGNGGGFAEMQAYAIDRSLLPLIEVCNDRPASCGLNAEESAVVRGLWSERSRIFAELIQINSTCGEPYLHRSLSGGYSIDACELYEEASADMGPVPKSAEKIGALVFKVRFLSVDERFNSDLLSEKLARHLKVSDSQSSLGGAAGIYRLHRWTLAIGREMHRYLSLETRKKTHDLTADLAAAISCPDSATQWELQDLAFEAERGGRIEGRGQISWTCREQKFLGTLYFDLGFSGGELVDKDLQLMAKEPMGPSDRD